MFSFILNGVVGFIISFFGLVIAISIIINANRILSSKNIKNYDVSDTVKGHFEYKKNLQTILKKLEL